MKLDCLVLLVVLGLVACATDERDWSEACRVNSRNSYQAFLQKHPSDKYSDEASRRVEEFDWSATEKSDDAQSYESYLQKYPKGGHLAQAEARLEIVRPIKGILGVALPIGDLGPSGVMEMGRPILTLVAATETFILRQTPDTKYSGISEERGGAVRVWFPGGEYEVTGEKAQSSLNPLLAECEPHGVCMSIGDNGQASLFRVQTARPLSLRSIRFAGGGKKGTPLRSK